MVPWTDNKNFYRVVKLKFSNKIVSSGTVKWFEPTTT